MAEFKTFFLSAKKNVEEQLRAISWKNDCDLSIEHTRDAMEYMVFLGDGGKRIRPALTYAAAEIFEQDINQVHKYSVGIELIHTYTLILDDIQDKSAFRRGEESCHSKYGFDTAILAANQLFELGLLPFHRLPERDLSLFCPLMQTLHRGQAADLNSEKWDDSFNTIENLQYIHSGKTSALFQVALLGGGSGEHISSKDKQALIDYGYFLGLAFQARDDILDCVAESEDLGKPTNADENKLTYPKLFGDEKNAQVEADRLAMKAIESIKRFGSSASLLTELAEFSVTRNK
ncbi:MULTISPECIES: polyprenyl synthetase family protein [Pseudoalteromonas]|uniref:Geranyl transferase n=1 Tax=Pseudoalteromonas amylolytica TaxID=1859457 RepID=A0A1S1MZ53_9GAMM|nr:MULTISPECIES: polyprenyl synthetase family protein [Pseudoalteromonas]OHU84114.1 hypothetical protein BFC16_01885 [Pseudoalteromonas sp. JW3]OHU92374.1 hypothetical protein BET10_05870 [Pseudoalteromonas amylolytica]